MLILFDNGTPRTLARYLIDRHAVPSIMRTAVKRKRKS